LIRSIKRILYPLTSRFFSRATMVEGFLKGTRLPFRCLLVGNSNFTEYLKARMYEGAPVVLRHWRIWIPTLKELVRGKGDSFDLCVAVLPMSYESTFQGLYDYRCTETVRQVIDTSGSWEDVRSRFSKKKRQITNEFPQKTGLGYRMSKGPEEFDFFYHRMHVPHIKKRFGELSGIDSYDDMKKFFLKGLLLFVTKGNEALAGALCLVENGTLIFRRTGVLDGDETHIEGGAQTALYYFQLKYANEHQLRAVDTMKSAPFLNDGVYKHKRDWGATVLPDDEADNWVYLFNARPCEKIADFFEKNPTVVDSNDGLKGVIGLSDMADASAASIKELANRYHSNGLHGFTVVTRTGALSSS